MQANFHFKEHEKTGSEYSMFSQTLTVGPCPRTIASKINVTPKGVYLSTSKLHSIVAVANLLAHNNKSQICYCGQISLQVYSIHWNFFLTI